MKELLNQSRNLAISTLHQSQMIKQVNGWVTQTAAFLEPRLEERSTRLACMCDIAVTWHKDYIICAIKVKVLPKSMGKSEATETMQKIRALVIFNPTFIMISEMLSICLTCKSWRKKQACLSTREASHRINGMLVNVQGDKS